MKNLITPDKPLKAKIVTTPLSELTAELLKQNPNSISKKVKTKPEIKPEKNQIAEINQDDWIIVPKKENNNFIKDSVNFYISSGRLTYSPAVEKTITELNKTLPEELRINYQNTSKDSLNREFIGDNNWKKSMMLPQFLGFKAPNMRERLDELHLLYLGSQNEINVYTKSGKKIDSKLCEKLLFDTIKVQNPWRADYIDADYKVVNQNLILNYNHLFDNQGNIADSKSEILNKDTLPEDKQINVINFITKNNTSQGHISKKVKEGTFYSYYPRRDNNSVARFDADSGMASLICFGNPSDSYLSLGVRAVRHE